MKTMKKYLMLAIVAVLTLTCLTGCGSKKIDVMYDLNVKFTGIDGEGRAEIDFENTELGFVEALVVSGDEEFESLGDLARLDAIGRTVDFDIEPSEGLSNGDKVTVTATVDSKALKELGYSAKTTSKTFTVEGLAVPTEIDAFKDFNITFSGISPKAIAEFESTREVDGAAVHYTCENNGELRLGGTVTITASVNDRELYVLAEETREFPVAGVDAYISQAEDIPDGLLENMKSEAEEEWANRRYNDYDLWDYKGFEYIGYQFGYRRDEFTFAPENTCYLVYKVTAFDGEDDFSFYFYCKFENLLLRTDGSWNAEVPGAGFRPGFSEKFQHNVIQVYGYETLEDLKAETAQNDPAYEFKVELP